MKIQLYKFNREIFNYPKSDNPKKSLQFAIAINEAMRLLTKAFNTGNIKPLRDYRNQSKTHSLTLKFINNAEKIACQEYSQPLKSLKLYSTDFIINLREKEIQIPFNCLIDYNNKKMIVLTFGRADNIQQEITVLLSFVNNFQTTKQWPNEIKHICYWSLMYGTKFCAIPKNIKPIDKQILLKTAVNFK